jgi:hypothetical protein
MESERLCSLVRSGPHGGPRKSAVNPSGPLLVTIALRGPWHLRAGHGPAQPSNRIGLHTTSIIGVIVVTSGASMSGNWHFRPPFAAIEDSSDGRTSAPVRTSPAAAAREPLGQDRLETEGAPRHGVHGLRPSRRTPFLNPGVKDESAGCSLASERTRIRRTPDANLLLGMPERRPQSDEVPGRDVLHPQGGAETLVRDEAGRVKRHTGSVADRALSEGSRKWPRRCTPLGLM